jgi:hypothetical protein
MSTDIEIEAGRAVVEQPKTSDVVSSSERILTVIEQLHACYDYCAAWKEPPRELPDKDDPNDITESQQ